MGVKRVSRDVSECLSQCRVISEFLSGCKAC